MYAILLEVYWVSKKGILHCTIYPWSDQFFLDRFRIASPKDVTADIGQRFIFSHNYGGPAMHNNLSSLYQVCYYPWRTIQQDTGI
jgi:hypothetical protein